MKLFKIAATALLCVALVPVFSSCEEDEEYNPTQDPSQKIEAPSVSVSDGDVVAATVDKIVLTYAKPVALNSGVAITLNDAAVNATVNAENRCIVEVPVTLAAGTSYTLDVPEHAVAVINTTWFAPAVKVSFSTEAAPAPVVSFEALVNPNATAEAVKVHDFLVQENGKHVLSGVMANVNNNNDFADWVYSMTSKYPALTCYDFVHLPESGNQNWIDYSDITPATTQWQNNGLVAYMWHWRVPTDEQAYNDKDYNRYGFYNDDTAFSISRALEDGTWEHECILADIDRVAAVFAALQDAGVPVLWRPLHEAAGNVAAGDGGSWFWWGREGVEKTKELWALLYDRLVNHHGLNNLIWVWTAQYTAGYESEMERAYPGNETVDVVGVDLYENLNDVQADAYAALLALTGGKKLVALSENGPLPDVDITSAPWAYFMEWYTNNAHIDKPATDGFGNTAETYKAVFDNPFVMNREGMPSLK